MDLWTFQRFQEPCLCVDSVVHEAGTNEIHLRSGRHTYLLAVDDSNAAAYIAKELSSLRDKSSPLWDELKHVSHESSWFTIGAFLDNHSLIMEGRQDADEEFSLQATRIRSYVTETVRAAFLDISAERTILVSQNACKLRNILASRYHSTTPSQGLDDLFDASIHPNFYLSLLILEFDYLSQSSPLTLVAIDWLLSQAMVNKDYEEDTFNDAMISDVACLYDERDLASHLWLVASCLLWSTNDDSDRFQTSLIPEVKTTNGLEFMRQVELITRDTLVMWGESPYITAINKLGGAYHPLVAGPFIEQYHVTRRFVEIISPLLHTRLSGRLREMAFQYFSEEFGHEALESTTCEALGVSETTLQAILPLPLHYAFVDILSLLALKDPIASFASVMTIEGIFGEPPRMSLRLAAAARDDAAFRSVIGTHDELNLSLNHNSISRDMFEQIKAISPKRQLATISRIHFLLELNHRAWSHIERFYGVQTELMVQGAYGRMINPRGN